MSNLIRIILCYISAVIILMFIGTILNKILPPIIVTLDMGIDTQSQYEHLYERVLINGKGETVYRFVNQPDSLFIMAKEDETCEGYATYETHPFIHCRAS